MSKKKSIITIIIFAVLIGSAYIVWPILRNSLEGENTENRTLVEAPKLSKETLSSFPSDMESYINDHLPFRSKMIQINSMITYYLMDTSSSDSVEKGKDDWLFYKGDSSMDYYTGRKLYSEDQLKQIAKNMQMTSDNCKRQGTKFVLLIAPNRERIYPEDMPSYYGKPAKNNALQQVVDYVRKNTDVPVVSPYDDIMKVKEKHPEWIYYHKTDTHWNDLGAYIGATDLFKAVNAKWDDSHIKVSIVDDTPGDMSDMLNLRNVISAGKACMVTGYEHPDTKDVGSQEFADHWANETPSAENGSILLARDSFTSAMRQYIAAAYKRSDFIHLAIFSNKDVEEEKPDVFVYETVERYSDRLLGYNYNNLSFETDINKYLDKLVSDKARYTVFISADDEASDALTPQITEKLRKLGVHNNLIGKHGYSFYSVISSGKNIAEDIGKTYLSRQSSVKDGAQYSIISAGSESGSTSSISINGGEYSKAGRGLNFVVYDNKYDTVIDSVVFDTSNGLTATR